MQQSPLDHSLQIELEKLPSIPHALLKLIEVLHDPDVSFVKIAEIIQTDPALTSRVMSVANSGAFRQWDQFKDFNRLVVVLGMKMVKSIAINSTVQQFFSQFNVDDKGVLAEFWQTSLMTASIARALAHMTGYSSEDEAYIGGLLHKLGELVCLMHNAQEYIQRKKELYANTRYESWADLESEQTRLEENFIGASVPRIGAWIISGFERNSLLADAVLFQRESAEKIKGASQLVQMINLAQKLAMLTPTRVEDSNLLGMNDGIFAEVFDVLGLNQPLMEEVLANSYTNVLDTAKGMGITTNANKTLSIDNETIQIELADKVRTIALSNSLQKLEASLIDRRSEKELIIQIVQNAKVLFDLSNCIFLAYDDESRQLKGEYGTNTEEQILSQFNISLDANATLPIQALTKGIPVSSNYKASREHSTNNKETVLDRQLIRLLAAEEILCIPLVESLTTVEMANSKKYGVLVFAISSVRLKKILREKGLLYEFSRSSTELISHDRKIAEQLQSVIEEQQSLQSLHIRKMVHEANNPLGVIRNYLQILSHKLMDSKDAKLQGQLEILVGEVERVGNIVLRIRDAPQRSLKSNYLVNINELVNSLVSIFKESLFIRAGIIAKQNLDASIPLIESNANSLKQIITNLLKNAVEAMPGGGEINISTRDRVNYNGKQFIELRISDSGPGLPGDVLNNLFNPVKSAKPGEHSGLGLSIIKNLVNDLDGVISGSNRFSESKSSDVSLQKNTGAEFIILLPRKPSKNNKKIT